jgi:hypothetical protein
MIDGRGRPTKAQAAQRDEWARKAAAVKALATEADDLAMDIVSLMGGAAEHEGSAERTAIFEYVWRLPKYDHEARRRVRAETR